MSDGNQPEADVALLTAVMQRVPSFVAWRRVHGVWHTAVIRPASWPRSGIGARRRWTAHSDCLPPSLEATESLSAAICLGSKLRRHADRLCRAGSDVINFENALEIACVSLLQVLERLALVSV